MISSEKEQPSTDPQWLNKAALRNYLKEFPEAQEAIALKRKDMPAVKVPKKEPVKSTQGII